MAARSLAEGHTDPRSRSSASGTRLQWLALTMSLFALSFLYFSASSANSDSPRPSSTIRVTASFSRELRAEREAVLGRQLSEGELQLLVQGYVDDEILLREAKKRGIRCSGCDGRRHLVKRLLLAVGETPSEVRAGDVEAFFQERYADYRVPERLSFEHVFFAGEQTPAALSETLRSLRSGVAAVPETVGDRFWLGGRIEMITQSQLETTMGQSFSDATFVRTDGQWFGPLRSARGVHLVRVVGRQPARDATLAEVRLQVRQDLVRHRRILTRQRLLARFRTAHEVVVEPLDDAA